MRVLVTGASGMIGSAVCDALLARGDEVVGPLAADPEQAHVPPTPPSPGTPGIRPTSAPPTRPMRVRTRVINLIGEEINQRLTHEAKRRIHDSRVRATKNLVDGMTAAADGPKVLVSQSAVGYYGDRGDAMIDESTPPGERLPGPDPGGVGAGGARLPRAGDPRRDPAHAPRARPRGRAPEAAPAARSSSASAARSPAATGTCPGSIATTRSRCSCGRSTTRRRRGVFNAARAEPGDERGVLQGARQRPAPPGVVPAPKFAVAALRGAELAEAVTESIASSRAARSTSASSSAGRISSRRCATCSAPLRLERAGGPSDARVVELIGAERRVAPRHVARKASTTEARSSGSSALSTASMTSPIASRPQLGGIARPGRRASRRCGTRWSACSGGISSEPSNASTARRRRPSARPAADRASFVIGSEVARGLPSRARRCRRSRSSPGSPPAPWRRRGRRPRRRGPALRRRPRARSPARRASTATPAASLPAPVSACRAPVGDGAAVTGARPAERRAHVDGERRRRRMAPPTRSPPPRRERASSAATGAATASTEEDLRLAVEFRRHELQLRGRRRPGRPARSQCPGAPSSYPSAPRAPRRLHAARSGSPALGRTRWGCLRAGRGRAPSPGPRGPCAPRSRPPATGRSPRVGRGRTRRAPSVGDRHAALRLGALGDDDDRGVLALEARFDLARRRRSRSNGCSGIRITLAPPAIPACSAIQPA